MPVAVTAAIAGYAVSAGAVAVTAGTAYAITAGSIAALAIGAAASYVVTAALRSDETPDANDGGVAAAVTMEDRLVTVRQPIASWQIIYGQARVGGVITYLNSVHFLETTQTNELLQMVITLSGTEVSDIVGIWANDDPITFNPDGSSIGAYGQHLYVFKSLGNEGLAQPFPHLAAVDPSWTPERLQAGRAKIQVQLLWNPDLFPQGIPNFNALVNGRRVYDPRTGLTAWSMNPALCIADFLTNSDFGFGADYAEEIDEAALIAAANICDETVALAAGGTEPRYTMHGAFKTSSTPKEILGRMLTAMHGKAVFIGGRWKLFAGAYVTPTVTLTVDDLRGPIRIIPRLSRRDICNGVKGVFVGPINNYQPSDFPVVTNSTYLAEDQGEQIWRDIDLPFTNTPSMAQRLAKIELEKSRQQIVVQLPCKLTAYTVQPGDTVMLTIARYGWSAKVFEVMSSQLSFEEDGSGGIRLGVDQVLRETAASVYAWNSGEETEVDQAPDTGLPDPFDVGVPGNPSIVESQYETANGDIRSVATVTWGESDDARVTGGGTYELEYKLNTAAEYTRFSGITSNAYLLYDLPPAIYEFRVRAVNVLGQRSEYSDVVTKELQGVTILQPADVEDFTVIKSAGFALAQWSLHDNASVREGGYIVIRHTPLTTGALWTDGIILNGFPGSAVQGFTALITGTYMAKALSRYGQHSQNAVSFVVTEGMVTGFTTIATSTQHPTFTGTKTNVAVVGGNLQLDGSTLFDSMLDNIDDWPAGDLGGIASTGRYDFDAVMDLTTVATRRYEADISAFSFDTGDEIDARGDLIDTWDSFDGDVINDTNIVLYAEITDDNPAGTPTWSPRQPFFVADFTARAVRFSLDFVSGNSTHNIAVSELVVHAKVPA